MIFLDKRQLLKRGFILKTWILLMKVTVAKPLVNLYYKFIILIKKSKPKDIKMRR